MISRNTGTIDTENQSTEPACIPELTGLPLAFQAGPGRWMMTGESPSPGVVGRASRTLASSTLCADPDNFRALSIPRWARAVVGCGHTSARWRLE